MSDTERSEYVFQWMLQAIHQVRPTHLPHPHPNNNNHKHNNKNINNINTINTTRALIPRVFSRC